MIHSVGLFRKRIFRNCLLASCVALTSCFKTSVGDLHSQIALEELNRDANLDVGSQSESLYRFMLGELAANQENSSEAIESFGQAGKSTDKNQVLVCVQSARQIQRQADV